MAESDDSLGCFGFLLLAAGVYFAFSNYGWSNSLWYSVQYGVDFGDVHTDVKPSDCDFIHAPLGAKGCSYAAKVKVYNADGLLVAGENAPKPPKLGSDTKTGKPIISYDDGKNWDWFSGGATTLKAKICHGVLGQGVVVGLQAEQTPPISLASEGVGH